MKVTGEKSLGSIIKVLIQIVFALGIIALIFLPFITEVLVNQWNLYINKFQYSSLIVFYPTGICLLVIVYNFIGLFDSLKTNNPFCKNTEKRLMISAISSIIISLIYAIVTVWAFWVQDIKTIIYSFIITGVFVVFAIAMYILAELFKQATKYKEENELTI